MVVFVVGIGKRKHNVCWVRKHDEKSFRNRIHGCIFRVSSPHKSVVLSMFFRGFRRVPYPSRRKPERLKILYIYQLMNLFCAKIRVVIIRNSYFNGEYKLERLKKKIVMIARLPADSQVYDYRGQSSACSDSLQQSQSLVKR